MTQIANLPQIDGSQTSFTITKNAVFQFSIPFPYPAGPQVPLVAPCVMVLGSTTLSGLSADTVASLVTNQPVAGYGIPAGTTVAGFPSSTSVTLSNAATQGGARIAVTFQPLPLDITGISFTMQILGGPRDSAGSGELLLELSTVNGRLINGGPTGILSGVVNPAAEDGVFSALPLITTDDGLPTDIVARAVDGGPRNLMAQTGPASVFVLPGVTSL